MRALHTALPNLTAGLALGVASSALAQDAFATGDRPANTQRDEPVTFDILAPPPKREDQAAVDAECAREQEAAVITGQIIVCRKLGEGATSSGFDKRDWERRYAERTQGPKTPDVEGAGGSIIYRHLGSVFMVGVSTKVGDPPEKPIIIDVEALPEAPPDSDADRIAKGLPAREPD
ncbi:MAG: hypothetical protein SXU28_07185 [Pseudomonadota bacterium]|nr:hypothetical protein [Pseudomonadota bacterium]